MSDLPIVFFSLYDIHKVSISDLIFGRFMGGVGVAFIVTLVMRGVLPAAMDVLRLRRRACCLRASFPEEQSTRGALRPTRTCA